LIEFTALEDIHALQLISEYFRGGGSLYDCYELNLVLENGKRINVVSHGDEDKLREDKVLFLHSCGNLFGCYQELNRIV